MRSLISFACIPAFGLAVLCGSSPAHAAPSLFAINSDGSVWVSQFIGQPYSNPGMTPPTKLIQTELGRTASLIADFNGDGLSDYLIWGSGLTAFWPGAVGPAFTWPQCLSAPLPGGNVANLAGDVDGDGKADLIAWSTNSVTVAFSLGTSFAAPQVFSEQAFSGTLANLVADMDGDGHADLIAWNPESISVMRWDGLAYGAPEVWNTSVPFYGNVANVFTTGSNPWIYPWVLTPTAWDTNSVWHEFPSAETWGLPEVSPLSYVSFASDVANLSMDVDGDGLLDLVASGTSGVSVMFVSTGVVSDPAVVYSTGQIYGNVATIGGQSEARPLHYIFR